MSKIESGKKPINLKRLYQFCDIINVDIFNYGNEIFAKWQPEIDMFEDSGISPEEILLLKEFFEQVKQKSLG